MESDDELTPKERIKELEAEIRRLKSEVSCPNCHMIYSKASASKAIKYCSCYHCFQEKLCVACGHKCSSYDCNKLVCAKGEYCSGCD